MKKKLFILLAMLALLSAGLWGETTLTYNFSDTGAVSGLNEDSPGIALDANIGFGSFKNSGTANPGIYSEQLRLYQNATMGGSIKIYASNGVTITQVIVNASGTTGPAAYTVDGGPATDLVDGNIYTMPSLLATDVVEFYQKDGSSSNRIYVDSFEVTYTSDGAIPPSISNLMQDPVTDITSSTTVSVTAEVDAGDAAIDYVELHYGTTSGSLTNTIGMSVETGDTYLTTTDIPAQAAGTTVYYEVQAQDVDGESAISAQQSYTVSDPATADLDYYETFNSDLGDVYIYNSDGAQEWGWTTYGNPGGSANMSGYSGGDNLTNSDWLITPAFDFTGVESPKLTFDEAINFGTGNIDNEQEVYVSTNYSGLGDPTTADWTELNVTDRASGSAWDYVTVNEMDLSAYIGESSVHIAFKYTSTISGAATWQIDNVYVYDAGSPQITVTPDALTGFTYVAGSGPSVSQSFSLSGTNLEPASGDLTVTGTTNFEVSTDGITYAAVATVGYSGTELTATDLYIRLKSGLAVGNYDSELISITGGGATEVNVTASGEVIALPPGLPYTEDFSTFDSALTIPDGWDLSDETYEGDWGSGSSSGLRGNANVLGYQHTSSSGTFTATLNIVNDTGSMINELYISYQGKVERTTEGRSPEWTVEVNGTEVPELFYSTIAGVDESKSVNLQGLSIADGELITIIWSSDRGEPSGSSKQIGITDVSVSLDIPNPQVATPVFDPPAGLYTETQFVEISCETPSTRIYYTINGEEPTTASLQYSAPVEISSNTTLKAMADAFNYEPSSVATAEYLFPTTVENIAALRSGNFEEVYYLAGEAILTYQQSYRNQKYIQDATAAILIDDESGVITTAYNIYDGISGIYGTLSEYENMLQFIPLSDPGAATSNANEITPTVVTLADLQDPTSFETYESELIQINTLQFVSSGTFSNGTVYSLTDGTDNLDFRTTFYNVDYIGDAIPSSDFDLICIPNSRAEGDYLTARDWDDFTIDDDYYGSTDGLSGQALWNELQTIISAGHSTLGENEAKSLIYNLIDNQDGYVYCIYTNESAVANYRSTPEGFSVEHSYAQSWYNYQGDDITEQAWADWDLHHLFPALNDVNSERGNYPFDYITSISSAWGSGDYYSYFGTNAATSTAFEVADQYKGNIARALLYFTVRYYDDDTGLTRLGYDNTIPVEMLPVLYQWHQQDPVDLTEINRNIAIYQEQGNRNPFVDHPEYVEAIWGNLLLATPTGLTATNIAETSFTANWDVASRAIDYRLDVSTDPDFLSYDAYVNGYKNRLVSGTSEVVSGLTTGITYYYRVKAVDSVDGRLSLNSPNTSATPLAQNDGYLVNFEGDSETKVAYASGTVNLSGLDWDMTEALIGTSDADWKNGIRSARMRGYETSALTMLTDKTNGIGNLSFYYRRYGTDAQVDWKVEYSTNSGTDWTQIGSDFTASDNDVVQLFSEEVNVEGNIRFRIVRATADGNSSNHRLNIDDILFSDYAGSEQLDSPQNVQINLDDDTVTIIWDAVAGANSYRVEAANEPDGVFSEASGSLNGEEWTGTTTEERKFYRVIALP